MSSNNINFHQTGPTFFGEVIQIKHYINVMFPPELKESTHVIELLERLDETIRQKFELVHKQILTVVDNGAGEGDWAGVYYGDELVMQGHRISNYDWEGLLTKKFGITVIRLELDDDQIVELGCSLPDNLTRLQEIF